MDNAKISRLTQLWLKINPKAKQRMLIAWAAASDYFDGDFIKTSKFMHTTNPELYDETPYTEAVSCPDGLHLVLNMIKRMPS